MGRRASTAPGEAARPDPVDQDRFSGFASLYDRARPRPPLKVVEIALGILGTDRADLVADLGSGTGLSTSIWKPFARRVVGIEPTPDMRERARSLHPDVEFVEGDSYATTLGTASTDIVTCSQSFHWMEPLSTLHEADRILREGGVFLCYDCDWPVTWSWRAEAAWSGLLALAAREAGKLPAGTVPRQYDKKQHLANLSLSGRFRHCGQVVFDSVEECDAERYAGLALSQGLVQTLLKAGSAPVRRAVEEFSEVCRRHPAPSMRVGYRLVYGVK